MTIFLRYWREALIAGLLALLVTAWNVIGARNETIRDLDIAMAKLEASTETDAKWTQATTDILTQMIQNQNDGIDRVVNGINDATGAITAKVDQTRTDNAKKVSDLKNFIGTLPTATDCSVMMENMIRSGEAVQW